MDIIRDFSCGFRPMATPPIMGSANVGSPTLLQQDKSPDSSIPTSPMQLVFVNAYALNTVNNFNPIFQNVIQLELRDSHNPDISVAYLVNFSLDQQQFIKTITQATPKQPAQYLDRVLIYGDKNNPPKTKNLPPHVRIEKGSELFNKSVIELLDLLNKMADDNPKASDSKEYCQLRLSIDFLEEYMSPENMH